MSHAGTSFVGYKRDMQLRTLHLDDLDDALALWERTEHLGPVSRAEIEGVLSYDAELVLVAEDPPSEDPPSDDPPAEEADRLLGVVLGTYDGRRGWIQRLAIDPRARRRGVARALVAELERRLRARGCQQVNLLVYGANDGGRRFWEDVGYEGDDRIVLYRRRLEEVVGEPTAGEPGC